MSAVQYESKHTTTRQNPLTGDWLVEGNAGSSRLCGHVYACVSLSAANSMAQTMDRYEDTGERKAFKPMRGYLKRT